jgi:hypothetical protein
MNIKSVIVVALVIIAACIITFIFYVVLELERELSYDVPNSFTLTSMDSSVLGINLFTAIIQLAIECAWVDLILIISFPPCLLRALRDAIQQHSECFQFEESNTC